MYDRKIKRERESSFSERWREGLYYITGVERKRETDRPIKGKRNMDKGNGKRDSERDEQTDKERDCVFAFRH